MQRCLPQGDRIVSSPLPVHRTDKAAPSTRQSLHQVSALPEFPVPHTHRSLGEWVESAEDSPEIRQTPDRSLDRQLPPPSDRPKACRGQYWLQGIEFLHLAPHSTYRYRRGAHKESALFAEEQAGRRQRVVGWRWPALRAATMRPPPPLLWF